MNYDLIFYSGIDNKFGRIKFMHHPTKKTTLNAIVNFTSKFNNEEELKLYLIDNNLLNKEYINYKLGIMAEKKGKKELLNYDIVYKNDLDYLNIGFIKNYFIINQNNTDFLKCFLDKYYNYLININAFNEELAYIKFHYQSLIATNNPLEEVNKYIDNFLNRYIYRKNFKTNKITINYRQVLDMGMFIKRYEQEVYMNDIDYEKLENEYNNYLDIIKEGNITDEDYNAYNTRMNEIDKIMIKRRMKGKRDYGVTKD